MCICIICSSGYLPRYIYIYTYVYVHEYMQIYVFNFQGMLFDLAGAAGLEQKRAAMASGQHINTTGTNKNRHKKKPIMYLYL
jgi:hypothetical protein